MKKAEETSAFAFGQFVFKKIAAEPTWAQFGKELVQNFNPLNNRPKGTGVGAYFDKWYNPLTKNTDPLSRGEAGLMRIGQAGMGVAGGLSAAAMAAPGLAPAFGGFALPTAAMSASNLASAAGVGPNSAAR